MRRNVRKFLHYDRFHFVQQGKHGVVTRSLHVGGVTEDSRHLLLAHAVLVEGGREGGNFKVHIEAIEETNGSYTCT